MGDHTEKRAIVRRCPHIKCEVDFAFGAVKHSIEILLTTVELIYDPICNSCARTQESAGHFGISGVLKKRS